jgi:deoxycytidine triphosphate deaminase
MSIKSDKWIRRMAAAHGMIEPFEAGQVRTSEGRKIVSFGTSSYGYDVRCSDEFKIFTNVHSTVVDPKEFDEKSFVNFKGATCIIPPNSFALARTVEYFRIPRNVLTICLGKCVTADTRLVDAESGAYLPITEFGWGRKTLSMKDWQLRAGSVSAFIPQGIKPVFELKTRAGLRIKATANHPFRQLHGWTELAMLKPGDRIAVARAIPVFGKTPIPDWEASLLGLMISEGCCNVPGSSPVFTSEDTLLADLAKRCMQESGMGTVTFDGRMGYRLVNHARRGGIPEPNRAHEWLKRLGLNNGSADKFVPQLIFTAPEASVRLFLQALFAGDGGLYRSESCAYLEYYSKSRRLVEDVHHLLLRFGIFSLIRHKKTAIDTDAHSLLITDVEQIGRFSEYVGFVPGSLKQERLENEILPWMRGRIAHGKTNFDTLPRETWQILVTSAHAAGTSLNRLNVHPTRTQSVPYCAVGAVARASGHPELAALEHGPIWDTVETIAPAGEEEVFDITVPATHNFLANGIVVHNSTYARCFSADTRVALVDGTAPTLEEMTRRHDAGEVFRGYSIGPDGRVIVTLLDAPRFIDRDVLVAVELDDGAVIHATPDHLFLRRDGSMVAAGTLRSGDCLMPLYRELHRGQEMVYQPRTGNLVPTRWLAEERHFGNAIHLTRDWRPDGVAGFSERSGNYRNHKVARVRELPGTHDVYCLTVPEAGNFALEAGVFVRNCGIIVNVTPLEPEWEGHVTLEFSNTTPLPAKIYANEGVAQMLFFESDEVCETSYADRGGKYQGQKGVTLPKV